MLGNRKDKKRRTSMGGGHHQASLREALRNRGGARALVTPAQSEAEDNFEEAEKPQLDWLNLTAFAPTSIKSAIDKIRRDLPLAVPAGKQEVVDDLEVSTNPGPGGGRNLLQPGLVGALLGIPDRKPKRVGGLNAALQARGGVKTGHKPQSIRDPQVLANLEQVACKLDCLEGAGESPSGPPLSSVREAEHEEEDGDTEELVTKAAIEDPAAQAVAEVVDHRGRLQVGAREVEDEVASTLPRIAVVPPKVGVEEAGTSEEAEEVTSPSGQPGPGMTEEEPEGAAQTDGSETVSPTAGTALELVDKRPGRQSPLQPRPKEKPSSLEADAWWMQESTDGVKNAVSRRRNSIGTAPSLQPKQVQPRKSTAPPRQEESRAERELRAVKLQDLRQYWSKNSVGFAGPDLVSGSRLSKGEAEATLQRLITAGASVDFEQVRRLRKHLAEYD